MSDKCKILEHENNAPVCDGGCEYLMLHSELAESVKKSLMSADKMMMLAELFRMFGDGTRIKILSALSYSEMCVCDLSEIVGTSVSAVSHQLRLLKSAKLVKYRREGKSAIYSLADEHVRVMLQNGAEHILEK